MIQEITGGAGVDLELDTTGNPAVINTAVAILNASGACGLTVIPKPGPKLRLDPMLLVKADK